MLRHRIYYRLKPFVPRSIRLGIRRWFATRKRKEVRDIWPIVPASERRPADWLGWPDGKQFALVLTHDVEGKAGLRKCRELMRLEQDLGFCSSFNFIPEGDYKVPPDLRDELESNGFEVGIHDLRHDGRLFLSRREFSRKAARINRYLRDWNAAGFRSGFMLHKLDWLHELNIQYDASTFLGACNCAAETGRQFIRSDPLAMFDLWQAPHWLRRTPLHVAPGLHAFLIAPGADG